MLKLTSCEVWRGPRSGKKVDQLKVDLEIGSGSISGYEGTVDLVTSIPCSGGVSDVHIVVKPEGFIAVMETMLKVNRKAALNAMGTLLRELDD